MQRPGWGTARGCRAGLIALMLLPGLAGCGLFDDEEILEGERIRIRPESSATAAATVTRPLPEPVRNAEWTQTNGAPDHNLGHLAGPAGLSRTWTADAGAGGVITSQPIVLDGTIYTLDADSQLTAFDAGSGARRWRTSLVPEGEDPGDGFGGGLAAADGRIFAATGYGEVLAIDPASGEIFWRQSFAAPFRAAPAAARGLVAAVTRDNRAVALDADDGSIRWRMQAATAPAGLLGGSSPAIAGPIVLLPFASGELVAAAASSGQRLWSAVLTGGRRGLARASITDVSGDPVVVGPYVVAANQAGRMIAIDGRNGQRVWTRNVGSGGPIWAAGDSIFVVSDDAKLMRLAVQDGSTLWAAELPAYEDPEDREDAIAYSGPVLVGGRVLLTDGLGNVFAFDGVTGERRGGTEIGGGSLTGPVVAGGTVYILADDGTLHAFR